MLEASAPCPSVCSSRTSLSSSFSASSSRSSGSTGHRRQPPTPKHSTNSDPISLESLTSTTFVPWRAAAPLNVCASSPLGTKRVSTAPSLRATRVCAWPYTAKTSEASVGIFTRSMKRARTCSASPCAAEAAVAATRAAAKRRAPGPASHGRATLHNNRLRRGWGNSAWRRCLASPLPARATALTPCRESVARSATRRINAKSASSLKRE
mmetsp:Transcript_19793/g.62217  ORF Transcript_19793/g.62217 Transcript_19793/m.62217 type:complete len:210 (-) Transcript_19793:267-896(-)